ncbi:MAG: hypothetical protein AAGC71_09840 [Pseudomonadota bacterium]
MEGHTAVWCARIAGIATLLVSAAATAGRIEIGAVTIQDTFAVPTATRVTFLEPFDVTPVVVSIPTNQGGDPAVVRISNISRFGFDVVQTEPSANDGPHVAMDTAYIAVEPGEHTLPGGARIIALTRATTSTVSRITGQSWDLVSFATPFASAPAVVTAVQTMRNESGSPPATASTPLLAVAVRNVNAAGFDLALERAESTAGSVTLPETIGIIAIDNNTTATLVDTNGNTAELQALITPNNIEGFNDGCFTNSFNSAFTATPLVVASMVTRNGGNGGWLRRCSLGAASVGLSVDEDIDTDTERNHIDETAAVVAASRAFHANLGVRLSIAKNVAVTSDPVNGASNPFAIPGATVRYEIDVSNAGATSPDGNSLIVDDAIPTELAMCVSTACFGDAPVAFDDSASPIPTGMAIAGVAYSNDNGASFAYTPTPDADGYDAAITDVRVTLSGTLPGIASSGAPRFALRIVAEVN